MNIILGIIAIFLAIFLVIFSAGIVLIAVENKKELRELCPEFTKEQLLMGYFFVFVVGVSCGHWVTVLYPIN